MLFDEKEKQGLSKGAMALIFCFLAVVVAALACGGAYTAIQQARLSAAKASLGQIESVFFLAGAKAEESGLAAPAGSFDHLLKSYDEASEASLTPYEKYVLGAMLDNFGTARDFDFALSRYQDGAGMHTRILFFPVRGRTNTATDRYYLMVDGKILENNM